MYKCFNEVFLSKEENELFKSKNIGVFQVIHVMNKNEVDFVEYPFRYVDGEDIDLF